MLRALFGRFARGRRIGSGMAKAKTAKKVTKKKKPAKK
jgi:hypothetical protein